MNWDYQLFSKINNLAGHSSFLDLALLAIAKWGVIFYGIALAVLWFKKEPHEQIFKTRKGVIKVVLSAGIALVINQMIGLVYFRPRPFATHEVNLLLDRSPDPSFPSDHATGAASVTASIFRENKIWGTILTVISLLLFFSRIYCGTHYPLDILGGMSTGFLGTYIANKLWPHVDGVAGRLVGLWDHVLGKSTGA